MRQKLYVDAYVLYREAISSTKNQSYLVKFKLNLAIVCLKLNLIKEYGENISSVLEIEPSNIKAIYHQAKYHVLKGKYD